MPTPIYIICGQSNAGTLSRTDIFLSLTGTDATSFALSSYWLGATSLFRDVDDPDWYPIEDSDPASGELYAGLIAHISAALAANPDAYLAEIIWVQGEADTFNQVLASRYAETLSTFIDGLRSAFGADFDFTILALSQYAPVAQTSGYWSFLRDAQLAFEGTLPGVNVVDPDVLIQQLEPEDAFFRDSFHYTYEFADALLRYILSGGGRLEGEGGTLPDFGLISPSIGTDGDDRLIGTNEASHLRGGAGTDRLEGNGGNDLLYGGTGGDRLVGGDGDDLLDGGRGVDRMAGGDGNDYYRVSNPLDEIAEAYNSGNDVVETSVSYTLGLNVETIRAARGASDLTLTGNELANGMIGGDGNDIMYGNGARDFMLGGHGNDSLYGGEGNDVLDGETGANLLFGGVGSDIYKIRSALDTIFENFGEGTDTLTAFVDYRLASGVEIERVVIDFSAGAATFLGNEFANQILGNAFDNRILGGAGNDSIRGYAGVDTILGDDGADSLFGGAGNDVLRGGTGEDTLRGESGADLLIGGDGNDSYYVENAGDIVREDTNEGIDTVFTVVTHTLSSNVERGVITGGIGVALTGNALDNRLTGGATSDYLYGLGGNDTLLGGTGRDYLFGGHGDDLLVGGSSKDEMTGGAGADWFRFTSLADVQNNYGAADMIHDFRRGDGDRIQINLIDANAATSDDDAFVFIGTATFSGQAGELRFVFDLGDTYVAGDVNGDALADFFIRLSAEKSLISADFVL